MVGPPKSGHLNEHMSEFANFASIVYISITIYGENHLIYRSNAICLHPSEIHQCLAVGASVITIGGPQNQQDKDRIHY